ncbi:MAG TPA: hypothetical protein ENI56_01100, partial [Candidatus Kaiserbacteria bacterium]|nr:hypothetical protein [Candidatus Kaiserbacteria bacterium]
MKNNSNYTTKGLVSSKIAARRVGFTNDYISKLCRFGKIAGKKVDTVWYVDESSLNKFIQQKQTRKDFRMRELSEKRQSEYFKHLSYSSPQQSDIFPPSQSTPPPQEKIYPANLMHGASLRLGEKLNSVSSSTISKKSHMVRNMSAMLLLSIIFIVPLASYALGGNHFFKIIKTQLAEVVAPLSIRAVDFSRAIGNSISETNNSKTIPSENSASVLSGSMNFFSGIFSSIASRMTNAAQGVFDLFSSTGSSVTYKTKPKFTATGGGVNNSSGSSGAQQTQLAISGTYASSTFTTTSQKARNLTLSIDAGVAVRKNIAVNGTATIGG